MQVGLGRKLGDGGGGKGGGKGRGGKSFRGGQGTQALGCVIQKGVIQGPEHAKKRLTHAARRKALPGQACLIPRTAKESAKYFGPIRCLSCGNNMYHTAQSGVCLQASAYCYEKFTLCVSHTIFFFAGPWRLGVYLQYSGW